jgi:hypothetical protein
VADDIYQQNYRFEKEFDAVQDVFELQVTNDPPQSSS